MRVITQQSSFVVDERYGKVFTQDYSFSEHVVQLGNRVDGQPRQIGFEEEFISAG